MLILLGIEEFVEPCGILYLCVMFDIVCVEMYPRSGVVVSALAPQ